MMFAKAWITLFCIQLTLLNLSVAQFTYMGSSFQLRSKSSGRCATVLGASQNNEATIVLYDCGFGVGNAYWTESLPQPNPSGGGWSQTSVYRYFRVANSGKCLTVLGASKSNLAGIIQWTCENNGLGNELFTVLPSTQSPGYFQLQNYYSGKCVTILNAATANESPLIQYDCTETNNQLWEKITANPYCGITQPVN